MNDIGSQLSKMFGDYKTTEVTVQKSCTNTDHYRSSTTNSYDKCIRELASKFPDGVADLAIKAIERHDQNSFEETVVLNEITKFDENTGTKYVAGKNVLHIKGDYSFKWFAHCKTIEMWVEVEKV
jgi:hypothetical protein